MQIDRILASGAGFGASMWNSYSTYQEIIGTAWWMSSKDADYLIETVNIGRGEDGMRNILTYYEELADIELERLTKEALGHE